LSPLKAVAVFGQKKRQKNRKLYAHGQPTYSEKEAQEGTEKYGTCVRSHLEYPEE
jgi:hypothetical protein